MKHFLYRNCNLVVLWTGYESIYQHPASGVIIRITGQSLGHDLIIINAYRALDELNIKRNRKEVSKADCVRLGTEQAISETVNYMLAELGVTNHIGK